VRRWLLLLLALVPVTAMTAPDAAYLAELVKRARALHLGEQPLWRKLVHYEPDFIGRGLHSLVDSAWFFLSPRGRTDPQAELEATLESFFAEIEETPQQQNPQCAFIARRSWLDEQLQFDRARLPVRDCPRYREWHAALNAKGLTLVFPAAYLNNPASMYGHTLLRVDARDQNERTRLLAYTVNFAANTTERNGIAFAVNGLLGGYPGTFSILPYYIKVREYSDMENRDVWEYELDLTSREIDRVVQHTWELLPAYFQYFFFDENCSYHLLGLLQVARPDLELTAPFRWWALPADTVRQVTRQPGLVARTVYRPANSTIINARLKALPAQERAVVKDLSLGKTTSADAEVRALPVATQAAVLETAHDYTNYRRARGESDPDPAALARTLLIARSQIDAPSQLPAIAPPERPEDGHGTARLWLGAGRRAGRSFGEVQVRPVYQDIMDPDTGYARGAQTEFFNTSVRSYEGDGPRVEHFIPIEIVSLSPRDDFFQAKSWRVAAGWRRNFIREGSEPLVTSVDGGMGGTWQLGDKARAYALAEGGLRQHHSLEGGYSLGAGGRVGGFLDPAPAFRLHAYAQGLSYFAGERDTPWSAALQARFAVTRNVAFRAELGSGRQAGKRLDNGSLSMQVYF
jgi:hypothetical protein